MMHKQSIIIARVDMWGIESLMNCRMTSFQEDDCKASDRYNPKHFLKCYVGMFILSAIIIFLLFTHFNHGNYIIYYQHGCYK